jgi:hypothetical protein
MNDPFSAEMPALAPRPLDEAAAIDIWIARWLDIRQKDLLDRYGCDPRRLYEIWEGNRFPASRAKALKAFGERFPKLADRVDFGLHRRFPRRAECPDQLGLFDAPATTDTTQPHFLPRENKT